jgi:hypothetical protein
VNDTEITPRTPSRHRRSWGIAAVAAAALVGAGAATAASSTAAGAAPSAAPAVSNPAHHHTTVLRFGVKFSDHYVVDVPPSNPGGVGLGDYALFSDQLLDRKGHVVGTEGGSGLVTDITTGQIFFTLAIQLPHGQIAASGLSSAAPSKELAVTGGTGRYVGAGGRLDLTEHGDGTGTLVLTLRT